MNKEILHGLHVFIFAVCGRSSSTALQRILNSSNEICIWGEQHHIIDDLINIIHRLDGHMEEEIVYQDVRFLIHSFKMKIHFYPYANAIGNLIEFKNSLIQALCDHLNPTDPAIRRFGFKNIRLKNKITLEVLVDIFPRGQFIFLFRNPIRQWPSVKRCKFWDYSLGLQDFLEEYRRISAIMLEFIDNNNGCIVFENSGIQHPDMLRKVLDGINIEKVDQRVVTQKKFSAGDVPLPDKKHVEIIKNHPAYMNYLTLKKYQIQK